MASNHRERKFAGPRSIEEGILPADACSGNDVSRSGEDVQLDEKSKNSDAGEEEDDITRDFGNFHVPKHAGLPQYDSDESESDRERES